MKHFFTKNGLWVLAVTALVSVLLLVISLFGGSNLFQQVAGTVVYPFQAAYTAVSQELADLRKHYADYSALEQQVAELERQVAELETTVRQSETDRQENARLRELTGLQAQRRDFVFEAADIVARDNSSWTDTLTLNRGSRHGIALGDCVVTEAGALAGKVVALGSDWCTVLTLIDTDTEWGAQIFRSGALAVAAGDFALMTRNQLKLQFLSADSTLLVGDLIVTSGFGGYYPSGLIIGTVSAIHTDDSGLAAYAVLTPTASLSELTQVFVIKDYQISE